MNSEERAARIVIDHAPAGLTMTGDLQQALARPIAAAIDSAVAAERARCIENAAEQAEFYAKIYEHRSNQEWFLGARQTTEERSSFLKSAAAAAVIAGAIRRNAGC